MGEKFFEASKYGCAKAGEASIGIAFFRSALPQVNPRHQENGWTYLNTPSLTMPRGSSSSSTISCVRVASSSKSRRWSCSTEYRFGRLLLPERGLGRCVEVSCHLFGFTVEILYVLSTVRVSTDDDAFRGILTQHKVIWQLG